MSCNHVKHHTHQSGLLVGDAECLGQVVEETADGKWFTETAKVFRTKEYLIEEATLAEARKAKLEAEQATILQDKQAEIDKEQAYIDTVNHFS